MPSRREFVQVTAAAGAASFLSARGVRGANEPGFRGTLCFFSKHLPGMDAPRLDESAVSPAGGLERLRSLSAEYRIMSKAAHAAETSDFESTWCPPAAERSRLPAPRSTGCASPG